jgi:hypothetical protein
VWRLTLLFQLHLPLQCSKQERYDSFRINFYTLGHGGGGLEGGNNVDNVNNVDDMGNVGNANHTSNANHENCK